jgi:hypothetical protein
MNLERIIMLSSGWPVLLCTGIVLGGITAWSVRRRANLLWFLPVLLVAAVIFAFVTGSAGRVLILVPEQLGIGIVALFPGVAVAFLLAWWMLNLQAPKWLLVAGPAMACLASSPVAGYLSLVAVCELIKECA